MKIITRRLDDLQHLPDNAKDHDLGAIMASIGRFGFVDPVGINTVTGHDLDGNGRLDALRQLKLSGSKNPNGIDLDADGMWLVPTVDVNVPEKDEPALAIALNRTNELGGWKVDKLAHILEGLAEKKQLDGTGYDANDVDNLLKQANGSGGSGSGSGSGEKKLNTCPECGCQF